MSDEDKHVRASFWITNRMKDGLDRLRDAMSETGDTMSRSEIARLLLAEGARHLMGDHSRTMRECVTDPAADEAEKAEARSRRGRGARRKGASMEREIARQMNERIPGLGARRSIQSRGAQDGADVECPIFWIEVKAGKKPNPRAALEQAIRDAAATGKIPIAVIRDDRRPAFAVLPWEDLLDLMAEWWESRE